MNPVVDPAIRLALALNASPGAYAVLLGSGISAAAGVPTGRQIVADLIGKVAALDGASAGDDPFAWYQARYGQEPDYSKLLDALAASPTERSQLLRRYFEPTGDQRRRGLLVPSAAHRALAQLAARGTVSMFLTTNFDRLLEQALEAAGVAPTTLSTPDALEGTVPLGRARCTVVKLNGDYLDTRIKNTPEELVSYHPAIDRLLDRVLDEYGLIICGWSAEWDTALRSAFERCQTRRYSTFWLSRRPLTGAAATVAEQRGAEVIRIEDADTFFTELAAGVTALDPGQAATTPGAAARLPSRAAAFIGRVNELKDVKDRLGSGSTRLLTLVGPGGTGKTTLAIRAASEIAPGFSDGVAFVDLASARRTEDVLVAIARAISLGEAIERPLRDVLTEHLRERRMLLVLDNFEQVTEAAGLVADLLANCPKLSVLVTSREPLRLRGEQLFPVPPLSLPEGDEQRVSAAGLEGSEAVQLFVDRAQAVRPDFTLTDENAAAVAEICRRLDGLPLAIELAAARLRLFSPQALQDQLSNRLNLLRSGPRDLPERQQTLRATMNWSYELLSTDERHLFELLSVFAGADIAAVEAVAGVTLGDNTDLLDGLTSLIEKSLVVRVDRPDGGSGLAMLKTIREFAWDRLEQRPDLLGRARAAHARYYADLVRHLQPDLTDGRRIDALNAMVADIENLRLAWDYWVTADDLEQLEKLAGSALILNEARGWYLATVALTTDMLAVLGRSASAPDRANQEIALRTSLARALMATKGYTPEVEEAFAKSIELFERGADARQRLSTLRGLANLYNLRGEGQQGARIGRELIALAAKEDDPAMRIEGKLLTGTTRMFTDDLEGGLAELDEAITLFPRTPLHAFSSRAGGNDPRVVVYTTSAITLWLMGYPDRAVERANAALRLAAELGLPFTLAYADFHAGLVHLWRRDFDTVLERMSGALHIAEKHGFQIWRAAGTVLAGAAEAGLGRKEGLATLRGGMSLYQGLRSPPVFWPILLSIEAAACLHAGRAAEGLAPIDAALEILSAGDGTSLVPELQITKGDLLMAGANEGEARRWYQLALDRAGRLKARISELRAATRLCQSAQGEGEHRSAALTLQRVYDGFTEGANTRDLSEARAVLDEALRR